MSTLTDALERILNWLQVNYPEAASSLRSGLSYQEIEVKLADLPFHLPQEVYELYQWRNGSREDGQEYIFSDYRFISLDEAVELSKYSVIEDLLECTFPFGWFPLFEFNGGYLAVIGAESKPEISPIVSIDEDESIAYTNLTGMMLTMAECYEMGVCGKNELEEDWQANREKELKICIKYNPEVLYFVGDRKNSKIIKRRYINGILKQEREKIQPVPNPIIGIIVPVAVISYIVAIIIASILASLIAIIKRLIRK